jgi:MoaA/NifB/PqqE/SkfB family radical SAM enzyme
MDHRRWSNIAAARASYQSGQTSIAGGPIEAILEVAARCNLACRMCAINFDSRYRPAGGRPPFFEPDLFERLRPLFPSLLRVSLFGLGEPTLNRHLVDYVRELSACGVEVAFNTNATLIDDAKAEALALAGTDCVTVSIDGATPETYEAIRHGAKFAAVLRGIRALVAAQQRHGRPRVRLAFVAMASNIDELPAMVDLCADLGAEALHVEPLYLERQSADLDAFYSHEHLGMKGDAAAILARAASKAASRHIHFGSRLTGERELDYVKRAKTLHYDHACSEPWSTIWVTSAGEVRTCCLNETSFGSLFEQTFDEIWNGEPFRRFRAQHVKRESAHGCGNCVYNGRVRQSPFFDAVRALTYRPLFDAIPASRPDDFVTFDTPAAGSTVTDPLVVSGSVFTDALEVVELMIDETSVANFRDAALLNGSSFVMSLPLAYVSEGAHVLWARRRGDSGGVGHRQLFFWRPDSEATRATEEALLVVERDPTLRPPQLTIGGHPWSDVAWALREGSRGPFYVARASLRTLPPGIYETEVTIDGRSVARSRLERLRA